MRRTPVGQPVMQWQILAKEPDKLADFYAKSSYLRSNYPMAMSWQSSSTSKAFPSESSNPGLCRSFRVNRLGLKVHYFRPSARCFTRPS